MQSLWLLFLAQWVWGSSYVAQKVALTELPVGLVLVFRYGIAVLLFLLAGQYFRRVDFSRREWLLVLAVGVLNFTGSPFFQLKSLSYTLVLDVSVMVAFEPIVAAILAVFFLKEKMTWATLGTFLLATSGILVMATGKSGSAVFNELRLFGDALFFFSLLCEGICSITARRLTQKYPPFRLLAWMVLAGFLANLAGNTPLLVSYPLQNVSPVGWLNLVYLGGICTVMAYGFWFFLIQKIPVNQIALSLFLQPIFGAFLAVVLLKEKLDGPTLLGAGMVMVTLLFWLIKQLNGRLRAATTPLATERR